MTVIRYKVEWINRRKTVPNTRKSCKVEMGRKSGEGIRVTKFVTGRRTCCARRVKDVERRRWSMKKYNVI